jgi:hypothetical protein
VALVATAASVVVGTAHSVRTMHDDGYGFQAVTGSVLYRLAMYGEHDDYYYSVVGGLLLIISREAMNACSYLGPPSNSRVSSLSSPLCGVTHGGPLVPTCDIEVTRDGRWWMITVPELAGYVAADGSINLSDTTQARHEGEIERMARDFIATAM